MVCWAFSELSQKFGRPICSLSRSRSARLPAMSKTVPQLGEPADQVVGPAAQVGVHELSFRNGRWLAAGRPGDDPVPNIAERAGGGQFGLGDAMKRLDGKVAL